MTEFIYSIVMELARCLNEIDKFLLSAEEEKKNITDQ